MASRVNDLDQYVRERSSPGPSGCIIWKGKLNHHGRAVFPESLRIRFGISVFVARYVLGKIQPMDSPLLALHKCDNPACINQEHLYWGTQEKNLKDMTERGRRAYGKLLSSSGESNPMAKLTRDQVEEIRGSSQTGRKLALEYGVSEVMISRIKHRHSWR